MSAAFELLHPMVQRKLWDMKWTALRKIQEDAIEHLLGGTATDCIISSPTASGKTEAAFLPVLSAIADEPSGGVRAIYIGPLKALINDQFGRLEELCTRMEMPVHRWHGDVDEGPRKALLDRPSGVLLITPESLEAMFVLRAPKLAAIFGRLSYVVIDETHAFLGNPRGAQLLSQLHRLRLRTGGDPIRVALSATLGDPAAARRWLRRDGRPVRLIAASSGGSEIRLRVRGLWRQDVEQDGESAEHDPVVAELARSILVACRGKTNLVFANSKGAIEELADELANQARELAIQDSIVVHHGSLSKEERDQAEQKLRADRPCTAVCSNTLELGIDIGSIDEVVQVSPPWSVASLVQRLGRSGRREGSARILRALFVEDAPGPADTEWEGLHLSFMRGLATIDLMGEGCLEPPDVDRANLSTAIQQILSILAETGGVRAHDLRTRLVGSGAFPGLRDVDLVAMLRELGARDLVEQLPDQSLVVGLKGQRIVEHFSFYAAFKAPAELQVVHRERSIGTLPENLLPATGEHVILAGRRWRVDDIDADRRKVYVSPSRGRRPPSFSSSRPDTAPSVHARMRTLLANDQRPAYLDETAAEILQHARRTARNVDVGTLVRVHPDRTVLSLWAGTRIHRTLYLVLKSQGIVLDAVDDVALIIPGSTEAWLPVLQRFAEAPDGQALAAYAERKLFARMVDGEKFDLFLPLHLWCSSYANERLDLEGAARLARRILAEVTRAGPSREPPTVHARVIAIRDLHAWADAVAALPVEGRLPARTVLVSSEAQAHALRCELASRAPHALAGTRFLTAAAAARAVLDAHGVDYQVGEEQRRRLRLRAWFRTRPALAAYRSEDLRTAGWEEAFASTIEQLELASLRPGDLERVNTPRTADLVSIWRALDDDAGDSWSAPRLMKEAHDLLAASPAAWPFDGPVLAAVPFGVATVHAEFLRALPNLTVGVVAGRPARRRALDRMRALLGTSAAELLAAPMPPPERTDEIGLLVEHLLDEPTRLAVEGRRRSGGPDGSVTLEAHAGFNEELDAAARWVAEEVFHHNTPVQDIAILVPTADPFAALIAERIEALPWPVASVPVYLACGRPAISTAGGALLFAVVNALATFLPASAMLELLPRLRLEGADRRLSPGRAREIVDALGTLGGSARRPEDALRWGERLTAVASRPPRADAPDREDALAIAVRKVAPAVAGLVSIAADMNAGANLGALWASVRAFVTTHVLMPRATEAVLDQLDVTIRALAADRVTVGIVGVQAMQLVAEEVAAMRIHSGRFGEPAVYVGTVLEAAGLTFGSVRIVGVAEGMFPRTLRDDAVLPSDLRRQLPQYSLSSDDDFATMQLHALDQVVRGVRDRLVVSAPKTDFDGSEREPAALFIEIAAALARPEAGTGNRAHVIPTGNQLERDAFRPARSSVLARRSDAPLTPACWLDCIARGVGDVPSHWARSIVCDPDAVIERRAGMHGVVGPEPLTQIVPGLDAKVPMTASKLQDLLTCPHRFLLERVLGFRPRPVGADNHRIEARSYGALVHRVAERFSCQHGTAFGARDRHLEYWSQVVSEVAEAEFDELLTRYPLVGRGAIEAERTRLRRDVQTLVEHDWDGGQPRTFVGAERSFGSKDAPLALPTAQGPLLVSGRIDRLDVEQGITLIRDFKTGRAHPRIREEIDPEVALDLQLAVYAIVTEQLATVWALPADVAAAYVYVDRLAIQRERSFRPDRTELRARGRRWLDLAMGLIREGSYVQTTDPEDCRRCPFARVCGDGVRDSRERMGDATGHLAAYRELKA